MNNKPRTLESRESREKVKLRASELRVGMFVCELDRPWIETPFLFEGFEIRNQTDLDEVQRHCHYVYVDLSRTQMMPVNMDVRPPGSIWAPQSTPTFVSELRTARAAQQQTSSLVRSFVDDVKFGTSPDVQLARDSVASFVSSILRNPDAMIFMTQMRAKDEGIGAHAFNTCIYSIILGRLCGLKPLELQNLGTCGLLHDVGKIEIPETLLNKLEPLTEREFAIIRQHTTRGRDILMSGRKIYSGTVDVAYGHHEFLDGSGYPRGLQGDQLNMNCRIVAITEKYDALLAPRPYRAARSHLDAIGLLNRMAKRNQLDENLVSLFINFLGVYPPGSVVKLNTNEIAIVLQVNPQSRLRPNLIIIRDAAMKPVSYFVNLSENPVNTQGIPYKIKSVHGPHEFDLDLSKYRDVIMQSFG